MAEIRVKKRRRRVGEVTAQIEEAYLVINGELVEFAIHDRARTFGPHDTLEISFDAETLYDMVKRATEQKEGTTE